MCVDEETIDGVLTPLGNVDAVNVVAIFGAARGGKSFLMNQLAGRDDVFKISNEKVCPSTGTSMASGKLQDFLGVRTIIFFCIVGGNECGVSLLSTVC